MLLAVQGVWRDGAQRCVKMTLNNSLPSVLVSVGGSLKSLHGESSRAKVAVYYYCPVLVPLHVCGGQRLLFSTDFCLAFLVFCFLHPLHC